MLNTATDMILRVPELRPHDIRAYDIAWSLHYTNLFGGHAPLPWDALSHTGLAYMLYIQDMRGKTEAPFSLALLLNNAAVAYVGEQVGSLQHYSREYEDLRVRTSQVIYARFNVSQELGDIPWDMVKRYDQQALAIEFRALFPQLKDNQDAPKLQYDISRYPTLVKARVEDYITLLKHNSINHNVVEVDTLFTVSDSLRPYLAAEIVEKETAGQQGKVDTEFRETKSIEEMRI